MSKRVSVTIGFLVDDEVADELEATFANTCSWVDEDWLMNHRSNIWKHLHLWDVKEVTVENAD